MVIDMIMKKLERTPFFDAVTIEALQDEQNSVNELASSALAKIIRGDIDSIEVNQLATTNERARDITEELADGQIHMFQAEYLYEHPDESDTNIPEYVDPERYMHTAVHVCGEFQGVHVVAVRHKEDGKNKYILAAEIKAYIANGAYVVPDDPRSVYLPVDSLKTLNVEPRDFFRPELVERMRMTREKEAEVAA